MCTCVHSHVDILHLPVGHAVAAAVALTRTGVSLPQNRTFLPDQMFFRTRQKFVNKNKNKCARLSPAAWEKHATFHTSRSRLFHQLSWSHIDFTDTNWWLRTYVILFPAGWKIYNEVFNQSRLPGKKFLFIRISQFLSAFSFQSKVKQTVKESLLYVLRHFITE